MFRTSHFFVFLAVLKYWCSYFFFDFSCLSFSVPFFSFRLHFVCLSSLTFFVMRHFPFPFFFFHMFSSFVFDPWLLSFAIPHPLFFVLSRFVRQLAAPSGVLTNRTETCRRASLFTFCASQGAAGVLHVGIKSHLPSGRSESAGRGASVRWSLQELDESSTRAGLRVEHTTIDEDEQARHFPLFSASLSQRLTVVHADESPAEESSNELQPSVFGIGSRRFGLAHPMRRSLATSVALRGVSTAGGLGFDGVGSLVSRKLRVTSAAVRSRGRGDGATPIIFLWLRAREVSWWLCGCRERE